MTASDAIDRRRLGLLALGGAVYTYLLVVYGGIVRITGSGMGCGDDWPICNDAVVPTFDLPTFIEYSHRVLAGGLALLTLWILVQAVRHRRAAPTRSRDELLRPAMLASALIIVQVLLGAVTVKLELPAGVTAVHFMTAMVLLATFLTLAVRAGAIAAPEGGGHADARLASTLAGLGLVVIGFGALTANVGMDGPFPPSGAAMACQGFPLCNGEAWPDGGAWTHVHWTHRLLAFALLIGTAWGAWRARLVNARAVRAAASMTAGAVALQIALAAGLVLMGLPESMQAAHLAVGAAVWSALVLWALRARRAELPAAARPEPVVA